MILKLVFYAKWLIYLVSNCVIKQDNVQLVITAIHFRGDARPLRFVSESCLLFSGLFCSIDWLVLYYFLFYSISKDSVVPPTVFSLSAQQLHNIYQEMGAVIYSVFESMPSLEIRLILFHAHLSTKFLVKQI